MYLVPFCILLMAIQVQCMPSKASFMELIQELYQKTMDALSPIAMSPPPTYCTSAGFNGCCVKNSSSNCSIPDGNCSCDELCHVREDCCSDIGAINCHAPPTCSLDLGHTSGCCNPRTSSCSVPAGNCSCDELCHVRGDCCSDIEFINCQAPPACSLDLGNTSGCCNPRTSSCSVPAGNCSCDGLCHVRGDCCSDIKFINCQAPPTCSLDLNNTSGCCTGSFRECRVKNPSSSRQSYCYCSEDCHDNNDCCADIDLIGCHEAVPATNCTTAGHTNGCCSGGMSACSVSFNGQSCFCDVDCYKEIADGSNNCCEDIEEINCFPQNCTEAGIETPCINKSDEKCRVITSHNTSCSCAANCEGHNDCCSDAESNTKEIQQNKMLEQLAQQIFLARSMERNMLQFARVWQRYKAALAAYQDTKDIISKEDEYSS